MTTPEGNHVTKICCHRIEYWFGELPNLTLSEANEEYIRKLITEDYNQGELCQTINDGQETTYGWWKIEN